MSRATPGPWSITRKPQPTMMPWMKLHTRDWLDNKELRRCSLAARAILTDLMCLAHEGLPYGYLTDKVGPLTEAYMASRCVVSLTKFRKAVEELLQHGRIHKIDAPDRFFIKRMVDDEDLRIRRAAGGHASEGHPNTPPKKVNEGYPLSGPSFEIDSRARTRADSDSDSCIETNKKKELRFQPFVEGEFDFAAWFEIQYTRHPKKGNRGLALTYLTEVIFRDVEPDDFERSHIAWCESEAWRDGGGKFVKQDLAQWVLDKGWRYKPPTPRPPSGSGKQSRVNSTIADVLREAEELEAQNGKTDRSSSGEITWKVIAHSAIPGRAGGFEGVGADPDSGCTGPGFSGASGRRVA